MAEVAEVKEAEVAEVKEVKSINIFLLGELLQNFVVEDQKPDRYGLVTVINTETSKRMKVHHMRISDKDVSVDTSIFRKTKTSKPIIGPKSKQVTVDMDHLRSISEVWVKDDVKFDDQTDVSTICMIFVEIGRYLIFNTYNGTFGKKSKIPPFEQILNGGDRGYELQNLDKLRKKLIGKGYVKNE